MRIVKNKDFRKLLSDSLNITSKLFKGLLKRAAGEDDMNPFSKGSMSFDDYPYKYYNDAVLNPKSIAAINDEENISLIAAIEIKMGGGGVAVGGGGNEKDSILTAENVREFESTAHFDEEGLNDFIAKPGSNKDLVEIKEVKKEEDFEEDKAKDSDKDSEA